MKKIIIGMILLIILCVNCNSKKDISGYYDVLTKDNKKIGDIIVIDSSVGDTIQIRVYSTNIQSFINERKYREKIYKKANMESKLFYFFPFSYNKEEDWYFTLGDGAKKIRRNDDLKPDYYPTRYIDFNKKTYTEVAFPFIKNKTTGKYERKYPTNYILKKLK